jgi:hypothetical protein
MGPRDSDCGCARLADLAIIGFKDERPYVVSVGHPDGISAQSERLEGMKAYSLRRIRGLGQGRSHSGMKMEAFRPMRWFAGLPLSSVAAHSLLAGLVLPGRRLERLGVHYGLLLALVPTLTGYGLYHLDEVSAIWPSLIRGR